MEKCWRPILSFGVQPLNRVEYLQLRRGLQTVPGLGFGRRRAVPQHAIEPGASLFDELIDAGRARLAHRRQDAAARIHDLHICCARDALLEFVGAIPGPDYVGMRIDKAGHDDATAGIDCVRGGKALHQITRRADRHNRFAVDGQRAVFDQAQIAQSIATLRAVMMRRDGEQLRGMSDEQVRIHALIIA